METTMAKEFLQQVNAAVRMEVFPERDGNQLKDYGNVSPLEF